MERIMQYIGVSGSWHCKASVMGTPSELIETFTNNEIPYLTF